MHEWGRWSRENLKEMAEFLAARKIRVTGMPTPEETGGFPRLKKDGKSVVAGHRGRPPCGLRAGDEVLVAKAGIRRRRRTATTVRHDGRCVVVRNTGQRLNAMASALTRVRRGIGATVR